MKVTSTDIKMALSQTRPEEYFLTEVKNGSTYLPSDQGLLIFDAVHIKRSWAHPRITIYEVKVSRSDFLQDNKWKLYLQYCNEFFFVVPKGMIDRSELPEDIGLIYYNPETKKLVTKQKSKFRQCENPNDMYRYIIYSRLKENPYPFYEEKAEYAKAYIEDKKDKLYIGRNLGSKMAKDLSEAYKRLEELPHFESRMKFFEDIQVLLADNDIYVNTPERALDEITGIISNGKTIRTRDLELMERDCDYLMKRIKKLKGEDQ